PDRKLIAVFELHTFSSLQKSFLDQYQGAMRQADEALVYYSPRVLLHKKLPALEPEEVCEAFGGDVQVYTDKEMLYAYLNARVRPNMVLLLMSSGTFDGMNTDFDPGIKKEA